MPLTALLFQGQQYIQQRTGRNNSLTPSPGQHHLSSVWPPSLLTLTSPHGCAPGSIGKQLQYQHFPELSGHGLALPCGHRNLGWCTVWRSEHQSLERSSAGREGYTVVTILKAGISDLASGQEGVGGCGAGKESHSH